MKQLNFEPTAREMDQGVDHLSANAYPGRIAIMGVSLDGETAIQAYALMGRSEPSKDRILVQESQTVIRTIAPSKTAEEMAAVEHSELIYYAAMQGCEAVHVVSNGAQTTPVLASKWLFGEDLEAALRAAPDVPGGIDEDGTPKPDIKLSWYEPDAPNFTPRITGVIDLRSGSTTTFELGVVSKPVDGEEPIYSNFGADHESVSRGYGVGYGIQTYNGDGNPLPSFDQEPFAFPIGMDQTEVATTLWDALDVSNRVAVVARGIDLISGYQTQTTIINSQA
jgi:IMP cyclohydrolase